MLGAMTTLVVDFADLDAIDVDRVREKLIDAFHSFADRLVSVTDFSVISQAERDVFVDIVWIIDQLVNGEEPKDKAKWERFVNMALNVVLIEQLPPLMRRETLLSLKSVTQGCSNTSTALKEALHPTSNAKRSRRVESVTKLGALGQIFLKCGDFNAQKHICEMLYRLVRANLLDQDVASSVFTHVSSQFKELLQIQNSAMMFKALKTLVRHYNAAQGSSATVRSFEADNLSMKGLRVHDNWINFGQEMMTFHVSLDDNGGVEPVDILYSNIRTFAMPERCVAHIGIHEKPIGLASDDPFDVEDDEWLQITFQASSISSLLEQLFRIGKQSTVVEMCLVNSNLIPSKKVSTGILALELNPSPEQAVKEKPKPKNAPRKTVVKVTAPPDSVTESESADEPAPVTAPQPARTLPKRKAKQDGLKKMNEQLRDDDLEDFELAEEPEPTASPVALRVAPPARQLKFTPAVAQPVASESDDESEESEDAAAADGWTFDDIPALEKMIKAKSTSKKQREELQRVIGGLKSARPRKSVFKTPAASLAVPKTGSRPAGILKSPDAKRLKTGPYDSAPDWKNRFASVPATKKETTTHTFANSTELNFDDDDVSGGGMTTSLSNMFNVSDDISPLLSAEKTKKKAKTSRTPTVVADLSGFGDDMAGFQQMMQSLAERNRRVARERINSLVNEFKIESETASRKIVAQIEQEYDAFARAAMRQVESRSRESAAVAAKVTTLTVDFKSALRATYEAFTANKRAAVADATRLTDELAALDAARAADVQKFLTKTSARRARVLADVDAAARAAKKNDGVKSMLLELAHKM